MTRLLLLVLLVTAVGFIPAAVSYARREPEIRARWIPAALRLGSLALLLLLLVNPGLPGEDPAARGRDEVRHWVVVEVHPVLGARSGSGETDRSLGQVAWDGIRARHASSDASSFLPGTGAVAVFGDGPEELRRLDVGARDPLRLDASTPGAPPEGPSAEAVARVLLRLAEAGADSLTLVTPLRGPLEPLEAAIQTLAALSAPVPVRVYPVGTDLRNAGVAALELPSSVPPGEPLEGAVVVAGEHGRRPGDAGPGEPVSGGAVPDDSLRVEVQLGTRMVFEARIPLPAPGERVRVPFRVPAEDLAPGSVPDPAPPGGADLLEVVASVELAGDAYGVDDQMRRQVRRGGATGGILLLSLRPDGEPRVLLPLLERATGLEGEGWIRAGPTRFVALGQGSEGLRLATSAELAEEIPRARLLVVQGEGGDVPPDWVPALRAHPRRILLASSGSAGEEGWGVDPVIPLSPLSGFLAGVLAPGASARLPPLGWMADGGAATIPDAAPMEDRVALQLRKPGGDVRPGVVLGQAPGIQEARVGATGLWRWAGREGTGGSFYRSLWGGIAAWVLSPGDPVAGGAGGTVTAGTGAAARAPSRVPAPPGELGAGPMQETVAGPRGDDHQPRERPLRTHPLPWLLLAGLLATEWILRRRIGLR